MSNLLKKYSVEINKINNIQWKAEDSNFSSALFYNLTKQHIAYDLFKQRISACSFQYCFVNEHVDTKNDKIIPVEPDDWRELQKQLCDELYPLFTNYISICVTGTNGKTTTVDLFRQCLMQLGKNVVTIGTLGVWKNDSCVGEFGLTSPSYIDFRKYLNQYSRDIDFLVVETSSHALDQDRFYKFIFQYGAWTSFSQDHLDYHKTMEKYFKAKMKIFDKVEEFVFISEEDGELFKKIDNDKLQIVKKIKSSENDFLRVSYNKKNLSLILAVLNKEEKLNIKKINLAKLSPPPGRFNIFRFYNGYIIIDFAHTPDALENICLEIKKTYQNKKLITIFGCGGDRDRSKRALMGKVATKISDFVCLTSDNPRFEKPELIIEDIESGIDSKNYQVILDREKAIFEMLRQYRDEVILIAGKGHENYIDRNGVKTPYSDEGVVKKVLKSAKD